MNSQIMNYKGYQVLPRPTSAGDDDLFFGGYEIVKDGRTVSCRTKLYPGVHYLSAACAASLEHAKIEIDNLVSPPVVRR
jgi:hypothetical protein